MPRGKKYAPTDELRERVFKFASHGINHDQIAAALGIDADTLKKHYSKELTQALAEANCAVAQSLFLAATVQDRDGRWNSTAQIFWLKTRARWKDEDVTGAKATININLSRGEAPAKDEEASADEPETELKTGTK